MGGGRTSFSPEFDDTVDPKAEAQTQAILEALKKRIPMPFKEEIPFEEVIAYIIKESKTPALPNGIPIYVDPIGLNEADKTMQSPVSLDLEGVALRKSLKLVLDQLGLVYNVKDGLLTITSSNSEDTSAPIMTLADKAIHGQMSLQEMNALIELFRARARVMRYLQGQLIPERDGPIGGFRGTGGMVVAPPVPAGGSEDAKTQAILAALEQPAALHLKDVPIEDALQQVRKATAGPSFPEGISIYHDPGAFLGHGPVTIDLKDVELKTILHLLLGQVGAAYTIKDGLLIIAKPDSPELRPDGTSPRAGGSANPLGGGFGGSGTNVSPSGVGTR
jgi:hypothetical protein